MVEEEKNAKRKKAREKNTQKEKNGMARNGKRNTTEYFDKRIGLEDDSMPMPLAERVY